NERLRALLRMLGMPNGSSAQARRLLASSAPMGRADAHPGKTQARDSVAHSRRRLASPSDRACRPPVRASGGRRYTFAVKRIGDRRESAKTASPPVLQETA